MKQPAPSLRDRFLAYIRSHPPIDGKPFSKADAARELGYSASMLSKYLNDRLEGDVRRLESLIEDALKSAARRQSEDLVLFDTSVSQLINAKLERIRRNNSVGIISGPAGIGKTCGIKLFLQVYPTAILITATRWNRDAEGMKTLLFQAVETRSYDNRTPRMDFVTEKLKGSNRLLIVDNAHRLSQGALELLFDFHDETGIGLALVGNEAILQNIRKNDQQFSRCAVKCDGNELTLAKPERVAAQLVQTYFPGANGALTDLVEQVISHQGHLRAGKHQLRYARDIAEETSATPDDSFRAAHTQLIRDYNLE